MVDSKDIIAIVKILRKVTVVVKLSPFVLALAYITTMIGYIFFSDSIATLCDQLFYTSPFMIMCAIGLSYSLKLCKWHRLECILPLLPCIAVFIDAYVYQLSMICAYLNSILIIALGIASLVNAYFVFIKPKR